MLAAAAFALLAGLGAPPSSTGRPHECDVLSGAPAANVWERSKVPGLGRYCDTLASATAKLAPGSKQVAEVVRLADEADAQVPGHVTALLLKGRALVQLGRYAPALAALRAARDRDPRALDDPAPLLAFARALALTGADAEAREAYRALLPRAEALPLPDRGAAYLGAGMLAMSAGPASIDETVAILRQARRDSQNLLHAAATYLLALALDRAGEAVEAATLLAEEGVREAASVMAEVRAEDALGSGGALESVAVEAMALEAEGRHAKARAAWSRYAAQGAKSPWAAHAARKARGKP